MIPDWKKHVVGCPAMRSGNPKDCNCGAYQDEPASAHHERYVAWPALYEDHGEAGA